MSDRRINWPPSVAAFLAEHTFPAGPGPDRFPDGIYSEQFVCWEALPTEEDHEHDPRIPCRWGFRCAVCHRDVTTGHCPDHAPMAFAGLRLAECTATPPHVTFGHDRDDYGLPCPWCILAEHAERDRLARQCRHWAWRRWALTHWADRWAYLLGVTSGGGSSWGDGHNRCLSRVSFTGKRPYILGASVDTWRCWSRLHRRGEEVGFGMCGKCMPWPCCGAITVDHAPGCDEATS